MIRNRWVRSAHVIEETTLSPSAESKWKAGRFVELATITSTGNKQAEFYVFYLRGLYVKVRSDFAPDTSHREPAIKFSELFVDLLQYVDPPRPRLATSRERRL